MGREPRKSGDSCFSSLSDSTATVQDWNTDFGQIDAINSCHSEIYASLASLTFLECYCDYFYLRLLNLIEAFCDNKSYVTKLNELQPSAYSKLFIHKLKEHEVYFELLNILPKQSHLTYVKEHQDNFKTTAELAILERLNIEADIIETIKDKHPLNIPLPSV